ncbi:E3 ubiquitin-protein ligase RNF213-like [Saccopteryx leptura]|uniref:E3 ubiquitin-protein ligase RNF213-like n=1 Tax=Saccopteryx leptura TaxID=249018 RepID=UPI00339C9231
METDSSEVVESKTSEPRRSHTAALDTDSLLRSSIQSAVGLLRDLGTPSQRKVRWAGILLSLLSEDWEPGVAFLWVTKMRLHDLLTQQEQSCMSHRKEWVVQEASNPDALQEAGTFSSRGQLCGPASTN